ncbi:MAG: hypothetical protein WA977_07660 [Halobacteriota archaeon]
MQLILRSCGCGSGVVELEACSGMEWRTSFGISEFAPTPNF